MYPELFHLGRITIYTYGLLFAAAIALSAMVSSRQAQRINLPSQAVFDLVVWISIAGVLGARLAFVAENFSYYSQKPAEIFWLWEGGLIFHGGVAGGLIFLWFFSAKVRVSFLDLVDFLIPYVALSHGIGRVGCFLNGCCYGTPFEGKWAVRFPFLDHAVHPVQIYSAVANLFLFLALAWIDKRKCFRGQTLCSYFLLYPAVRIFLEFYRGDKTHGIFSFATTTQFILAIVFIIALPVYIFLSARTHRR